MTTETFTFYYNRHSVCSLMTKYSIAIRGQPKNSETEYSFSEKELDIFEEKEQLAEDFLCNVNAKGQVPVLAVSSSGETVLGTVAITHLLADTFPDLIPEPHREQISRLLDKLHSINFFSLTFGDRNLFVDPITQKIQQILEGDISSRYRDALNYKLGIQQKEKVSGLASSAVDENMQRAREFLMECEESLPNEATWLFDMQQPTVLDAHVVTFLARMRDVGKARLISPRFMEYLLEAEKTEKWQSMMEGRRTLPPHFLVD